jgi:hypothetical protein
MAENREKQKMVSISEDYLAFLHDELAENQARLKEMIGDSQAQAVFCYSADRLISTVKPGRYAKDPLEGMVRKLKSWGMEVSRKDKGKTSDIDVKCPYAETVHPKLSTSQPKCPLGEYILGAVRLEDPKALLVRNDLNGDGVRFRVAKSD